MTSRPIALALAFVLAAGCGGGTQSHGAGSETAAPTITLAHARDLVHVGLLRTTDLPGWKRGHTTTSGSGVDNGEVFSCAGILTRQGPVLDGDVIEFTRGIAQVQSDLDVAATPALAAQDSALTRTPTITDCAEKELTGGFAAEHFVVSKYRTTPFHTTSGGLQVDGFTATMTLTKDDVTAPYTLRAVTAAVGHAVIFVTGGGLQNTAPTMASLIGLLGKSAARLRKVHP